MRRKITDLTEATQKKFDNLNDILSDMGKVLVAFSGGVDSTFLLAAAKNVLGEDVLAVIASSETYPQREIEDAKKIAQEMGIRYIEIHTSELENPNFSKNPPQRCYYCKQELFSKLKEIAQDESIPYVLDGSNFDDTDDFRPGLTAAKELGIRSPLKEAELRKDEIRVLSKELDLNTWDKPSLACLSSRFPYYTEIRKESLKQVGQAEDFLRNLGFTQVRVRHYEQIARIEIEREEFPRLMEEAVREKVVEEFKRLGYTYISLDLAGYRTGSMNESLSEQSKKLDWLDK